MNEFTAKKLGEVLAFAHVGAETFAKGRAALEQGFGATQYMQFKNAFEKQKSVLETIAHASAYEALVNKKVEGTGAKLRAMREMYVGDEWDNFTELLEWHGFFEGAAIVHWQLVVSAAHAISHHELLGFANEALAFHQTLLATISLKIHAIGGEKAKG